MSQVIASKEEDKRVYTITGDLTGILKELNHYLDEAIDDATYEDGEAGEDSIAASLDASSRDYDNGTVTKDKRKEDRDALRAVVAAFESPASMEAWIASISRKANGTFAKNRRKRLWAGYTFCDWWQDSYGWFGPELSLKSISDTEARLEFDSRACVEKY